MVDQGVEFQFPEYEVDFHIRDGKAVALVSEQAQESGLVDQLYQFLLFMSQSDPYGLVDISRSRTWDDLQGRFKQWAEVHVQ